MERGKMEREREGEVLKEKERREVEWRGAGESKRIVFCDIYLVTP